MPRPKAECPIDEDSKRWLEANWRWLTKAFERDRLYFAEVLEANEQFFPDHYDETLNGAFTSLLVPLCNSLEIDPDRFEIQIGRTPKSEWHTSPASIAASSGRHCLQIEAHELAWPKELMVTLACQLSSLLLVLSASLRKADLRGATLCGADLSEADLTGADLRGADIRNANFSSAILDGANLCAVLKDSTTELTGAHVSGLICDPDFKPEDLRGDTHLMAVAKQMDGFIQWPFVLIVSFLGAIFASIPAFLVGEFFQNQLLTNVLVPTNFVLAVATISYLVIRARSRTKA